MNHVRARRQAQGMNKETLAGHAALSVGMLWRIETGRSQPTIPVAHRLAAALGVPLTDLFPPEPTPSTLPAPEATADLVAPGSAA